MSNGISIVYTLASTTVSILSWGQSISVTLQFASLPNKYICEKKYFVHKHYRQPVDFTYSKFLNFFVFVFLRMVMDVLLGIYLQLCILIERKTQKSRTPHKNNQTFFCIHIKANHSLQDENWIIRYIQINQGNAICWIKMPYYSNSWITSTFRRFILIAAIIEMQATMHSNTPGWCLVAHFN